MVTRRAPPIHGMTKFDQRQAHLHTRSHGIEKLTLTCRHGRPTHISLSVWKGAGCCWRRLSWSPIFVDRAGFGHQSSIVVSETHNTARVATKNPKKLARTHTRIQQHPIGMVSRESMEPAQLVPSHYLTPTTELCSQRIYRPVSRSLARESLETLGCQKY
jgi:hypothetical protein